MPQKDLNKLRVLVTRPFPEGEELCQLIDSQGGQAIYLPVFEIVPNPDFRQSAINLDQFDMVIFNSPQAVYQSESAIIPKHLQVAAIGRGTAKALERYHLPVHIIPLYEWSTEGLLKLKEFQQIEGKKIAIIKGQGGRGLLTKILQARGAKVQEFIAYKRILPKIDTKKYLDLLRNEAIDVIICTSNEGLQNLKILLSSAWDKLRAITILVISERILKHAKELGFEKVLLAGNANNQTLLDNLGKTHGK